MNVQQTKIAAWPLVVVLGLWGAACGTSQLSPTPVPSETPVAGVVVSGGARLSWDQSGSSAQEVSAYQYTLYLDGRPQALSDTRCGPTGPSGAYPCSGLLPSMSSGQHVLELSAAIRGVESPRSAPLTVTATASAQVSDSAAPADAVAASDDSRSEGQP